jgi:hypothetical protein
LVAIAASGSFSYSANKAIKCKIMSQSSTVALRNVKLFVSNGYNLENIIMNLYEKSI